MLNSSNNTPLKNINIEINKLSDDTNINLLGPQIKLNNNID